MNAGIPFHPTSHKNVKESLCDVILFTVNTGHMLTYRLSTCVNKMNDGYFSFRYSSHTGSLSQRDNLPG